MTQNERQTVEAISKRKFSSSFLFFLPAVSGYGELRVVAEPRDINSSCVASRHDVASLRNPNFLAVHNGGHHVVSVFLWHFLWHGRRQRPCCSFPASASAGRRRRRRRRQRRRSAYRLSSLLLLCLIRLGLGMEQALKGSRSSKGGVFLTCTRRRDKAERERR